MPRMRARAKRKLKNTLFAALWLSALVCFIVSAGMLIAYQLRSQREKNAMQTVAEPMQKALAATEEGQAQVTQEVQKTKEQLAAENPDMVGWVSVRDTNLSYPVMHTPADPEYYLKRDFSKQWSSSGMPFLDAQCTVDGTGVNSIIYGHNMKNKTMFSLLERYTDYNYFKEHPVIRYESLTAAAHYMVFAVLKVDTRAENPDALTGYQTLQGANEASYQAYISYLKANSLYDTSATPVYGDTLLTLSTCDNITDTGRILVCAMRVSQA